MTLPFASAKVGFIPQIRTNNQITAPELRVIDETGKNLGVLTRDAAFTLAKGKGLDIIEIAPMSKPPVARIMSFDKFRYLEEKKEKRRRAEQKSRGMKQVQLSGRIAKNDLNMKLRRIEKFLGEGYQVNVVLTLRGREKANKPWAFQKLKEFLTYITIPHQVTSQPKLAGRGITLTLTKK